MRNQYQKFGHLPKNRNTVANTAHQTYRRRSQSIAYHSSEGASVERLVVFPKTMGDQWWDRVLERKADQQPEFDLDFWKQPKEAVVSKATSEKIHSPEPPCVHPITQNCGYSLTHHWLSDSAITDGAFTLTAPWAVGSSGEVGIFSLSEA